MIKIENTQVTGWESAIRGMRNPLNSWAKSDSFYNDNYPDMFYGLETEEQDKFCDSLIKIGDYNLGPNDQNLMMRLRNAGKDHRKFMRMIVVYADWTAPLSWWKEADTYKVGTVRDSCSTMHKITSSLLDIQTDITSENLSPWNEYGTDFTFSNGVKVHVTPYDCMLLTVTVVNNLIDMYNNENDAVSKKIIWRQIIDLLPSSYNQRATMMLNYEVLANMYHARKNHKMTEWHTLCRWIEGLPFSKLITGKEN